MTMKQRMDVLNAANAARMAGQKANAAAIAAIAQPYNRALAKASEAAALEAYHAAQAAEDAAMSLDPDEALENEQVWETHCIGMGAADRARRAAERATYQNE